MVQQRKSKLRSGRKVTQSHGERRAENWMQTHWRPMMAWQYMITCLCDFVVFPVMWSALQSRGHGELAQQWQPITLLAGGFYHMSMGAIIGISSWGRTKEKTELPLASNMTYGSPPPTYGSPAYGSNAYGNNNNAYGSGNTYGDNTNTYGNNTGTYQTPRTSAKKPSGNAVPPTDTPEI